MNILAQFDDAVFIQNQQVKTTSLKVAELFDKRHDHVLRKIENILTMKSIDPNFGGNEFIERNFALNEYKDSIGRTLPMYEMTKDGFIFLVMGFTGEEAAQTKIAYINTFTKWQSCCTTNSLCRRALALVPKYNSLQVAQTLPSTV